MAKRAATTELNHENWDNEDEDEEPTKEFKMANSDVLSKRVFKRGKRRLTESTTEAQPSPFAKFSFGSTNSNSSTSKPAAPFSFFSNINKSPATMNGASTPGDNAKSNGPEDTKKTVYLAKLKSLNEEFLSWIKKHIEKNAYCILTPCLEDYGKYLKEIEAEQDSKSDAPSSPMKPTSFTSPMLAANKDGGPTSATPFSGSLFGNLKPPVGASDSAKSSEQPQSGGSIFGNTSSSQFSFGSSKPFTFSSTGPPSSTVTQPPAAGEAQAEESDEPPKNEFNLVKEDDAVFSQRVKVFVKKDKEDYADRGVGTLYIKPANDKFQVVVRADTSLGNLLMNIVLSESMPMKRMGKNNVLLVCVPVPGQDSKPVPTLLRVKTKEDADKLFDELEKRKK